MPFELNRMKQKVDAGARYAVTQPIIGNDEHLDRLKEFNIAVVVEAWMSNNIDLLYRSIGKEKDEKIRSARKSQSAARVLPAVLCLFVNAELQRGMAGNFTAALKSECRANEKGY